jgi:dihydrodipicolinate synthase/N-acetylneuraminate lyase
VRPRAVQVTRAVQAAIGSDVQLAIETHAMLNAHTAVEVERLFNMTFLKVCLEKRGIFKNSLTRVPEPALDTHDHAEPNAIWAQVSPQFQL